MVEKVKVDCCGFPRGMKPYFSESQIVEIWQHLLLDRTALTTQGGEPIRIIYPGRINDDRGADLLDAVVATSQGVRRGDVEVHVKSSSWWAHRHHQDSSYNRLILHVVFWHDTQIDINLQNGQEVPTLALSKYTDQQANHYANFERLSNSLLMPCRNAVGRWNAGVIGEFLDSAGEERFLAKTSEFQKALAQTEGGQSLYQGIMGALGYVKNKPPMLKLARRLPLQILQSMTGGEVSDQERLAWLQALLLGTAGLLPSQRQNGYQEYQDDS